ncbi:MAG TPA: methyltransferase domain-containing protein [Fibrobacteria bacterium]|nr:methyltransferase domain-containing protein [Fibrobacteria bacterium]
MGAGNRPRRGRRTDRKPALTHFVTPIHDRVYRENARFVSGLLQGEKDFPARAPRVLDVGCHKCFLKGFLPAGSRYTGLNIDKTGEDVVPVDLNRGRLPAADAAYDAVVCTDVLEHLFCPEKIAAEIQRCLKPGGIFVISLPNDIGITVLLSFLLKWFRRTVDPIPVQRFDHHWKFSYAVSTAFFREAGLAVTRAELYVGPYIRFLTPLIRLFPSLCTTWFFVGRKPA